MLELVEGKLAVAVDIEAIEKLQRALHILEAH